MKIKKELEVMREMQSLGACDLYLYGGGGAPKNFFHAAPKTLLQLVPRSRKIVQK